MQQRLTNKEVVYKLKEVLAAMEVKNYNLFRIRAYQNAIAAIESLTMNVYDIWEKGRLGDVDGIGSTLYQHLDDLFTKGEVKDWEAVKKDLPEGMFELIGIRGVGAKRAFKLAQAFDIKERQGALEKLKEAAELKKIQELDGFGEKIESQILDAITEAKMTKNEKQRLLLVHAESIAERISSYMADCSFVQKLEVLGSLRRKVATVGDLDIAVATDHPDEVMDFFLKFPEIAEVLAKGDKKISVNLKNDVQIDLRVIHPETFGSMVQYFTGSKQHNVQLRTFALEKGLSLSEYGIKEKGKLLEFASEKEFYAKIGLDYIEPELREAHGEVLLAAEHKLPDLVEVKDIRGDVHVHTTASDGLNTVNEMVEAGIGRGYEYVGISDHNPSVHSRGLEEVLRLVNERRLAIEKINDSQDKIKVLFGYEVNILADSTLSLPYEVLKKLDYVIAAIHTSMNQPVEEITNRLLSAIRNPLVTIIGHPAGRLIGERGAYDVDWEAVFEATEKYDKILEINSQPNRLDLVDDLVREAKNREIKLMINTDAHDVASMDLIKYGINVARRGWCEKEDIVNTLPADKFLRLLGK